MLLAAVLGITILATYSLVFVSLPSSLDFSLTLLSQTAVHGSLRFNSINGFVFSSRADFPPRNICVQLKLCHRYCIILVSFKSNLLICCLDMAALMWTKAFLVFLNISFHRRLSPAGHAFLAAWLNVQKSFWITVEYLVSICCQTFLIASTSET